MKFLSRFFPKQPVVSLPGATKIGTPPVVLRLYPTEIYSDLEVPNSQAFILRDWRCDEVNYLTSQAAIQIRRSYDALGKPDVYGIGIPLTQGYHLHVAQMAIDKSDPTQGKVHMVLYISASDYSVSFGKNQELYGPLTPQFMELMQHIAIRLNAVPSAIQTMPDGSILVMFFPHDPQFDLKKYFDEYYNSPTWRVKVPNNGAAHDPDVGMAGG